MMAKKMKHQVFFLPSDIWTVCLGFVAFRECLLAMRLVAKRFRHITGLGGDWAYACTNWPTAQRELFVKRHSLVVLRVSDCAWPHELRAFPRLESICLFCSEGSSYLIGHVPESVNHFEIDAHRVRLHAFATIPSVTHLDLACSSAADLEVLLLFPSVTVLTLILYKSLSWDCRDFLNCALPLFRELREIRLLKTTLHGLSIRTYSAPDFFLFLRTHT